VIDFIEALYELAETCQFGDLNFGIRNASLSQKLMQDEKLTLDKAVKETKSSEVVKHHHNILHGDGEDGKLTASARVRDEINKNRLRTRRENKL
jgi:hypothetical protein